MKNYLFLLLGILFGCTTTHNELRVSYIANCGFLYESQSAKVVIDPFGTGFGDYFFLPSPELQTNMEKGNAPFDKIDLVLITHQHGDHFNPLLAERFLLQNKQAKMMCPPQVLKLMHDSCAYMEQISSQIVTPQLSMHEAETISIAGVTVTAVRMQHGTDRNLEGIAQEEYTDYEKTENYGYLIDFNQKLLFHQGDGCLKINQSAIEQLNRNVDIAHLSFFDWDPISYQLLKEKLHAKNIIFMHGTKPGNELGTEELRSIAPKVIFFKQELESKLF